eukprot:gene3495-13561_t
MLSATRQLPVLAHLASALSCGTCSFSSAVALTDWKAVAATIPKDTLASIKSTVGGGQAFGDDLRSSSGLGAGDGLTSHTDKWMQGGKSPMEWIREAAPIDPHPPPPPTTTLPAADDPLLGCPVEYINLKGTSKENPAVCKYTGNRFWSPAHTWNAH